MGLRSCCFWVVLVYILKTLLSQCVRMLCLPVNWSYTNEEYAIAKIAGLKMCESYNLQYGDNYLAVMPTNLYGPNDNFHLENSHVIPAMMRKSI